MKINTHGLKLKNLRKVCGATENHGWYSGHDEIFYDTATGEISLTYHISDNSWTVSNDPDVIFIRKSRRHMTMQEIADAIYAAINRKENDHETVL